MGLESVGGACIYGDKDEVGGVYFYRCDLGSGQDLHWWLGQSEVGQGQLPRVWQG